MRCKGVFSLLVGLNLRVQCGVYLCPRTHCCGIVVNITMYYNIGWLYLRMFLRTKLYLRAVSILFLKS